MELQTLDVYIDPGMVHKQRIVFSGEGDQEPDSAPGDVVVFLVQRPHPVFTRDGDDLHVEVRAMMLMMTTSLHTCRRVTLLTSSHVETNTA